MFISPAANFAAGLLHSKPEMFQSEILLSGKNF